MRWKRMESAPKDGRVILILTHDFGIVQGRWDDEVTNFYKSDPEFKAVYDPDNAQGDWVSLYFHEDKNDPRLICGFSPQYWLEIEDIPSNEWGQLFDPMEFVKEKATNSLKER